MVKGKYYNRQFWATTFTLTGTIIGAGILGLPYVFSQSGYLMGLFWLLFLGSVVLYVFLCLGEVALRTRSDHQLPGFAKKYLGQWGEWLMVFAFLFGVYSALLAYLVGEGTSLSLLFTGGTQYAVHFAIGFWFLMALILKEGLRGLKKVQLWGVLGIIVVVLVIVGWYFPDVTYINLGYVDYSNVFLPFGVILFALMGFTAIPELEFVIKGHKEKFRRAIVLGVLIPVVSYVLFTLVFVGVLGKDVPQVATLGFGKLVILLGFFTMLTSYFGLSFSLKDVFRLDLKLSRDWNFVLASLVPLFGYLLLMYFNWLDFISILGIGGVVSGGLTGILILLISKQAKEKGDMKPKYEMPVNWFIIGLISLIFIFGVVVELGF
jgi:amino acid permease